jgi:hypothetical protein
MGKVDDLKRTFPGGSVAAIHPFPDFLFFIREGSRLEFTGRKRVGTLAMRLWKGHGLFIP